MSNEANIQDAPSDDQFVVPNLDSLSKTQAQAQKEAPAAPQKQESAQAEVIEDTGKQAEAAPDADSDKKETQADKDRAHEAFLLRQARREAREAKEQFNVLSQELADLRKATTQAAPKAESGPPKPPHPDSFKYGVDDNDYIAAQQKYLADHGDYIAKQAEETAYKRFQDSLDQAAAKEYEQKLESRINDIIKRGLDKYPDFDHVVEDAFSAMQPDKQALQSLAQQDGAEEVVYYLSKNPEVLERITGLDPMAQAFEMGRMASQFSAKRETPKVQVTKATATPSTPRGANGQFSTSEDALYSRLLKQAKW